MGKLDFGIAMVRARFVDKESPPPGTIKKGSFPKVHSLPEKVPGKRMDLIVGSWLKYPPKEKILFPSDNALGSWMRRELLLKR